MTNRENNIKKIIITVFFIFLAITFAYYFFKYILACVLPFTIAFGLAHSTRKIILKLNSKLKLKRSFSVFLITVAVVGITAGIIYLLASRIFSELSVLSAYLSEERLTAFISDTAESITSFGEKYFPDITAKLAPHINNMAKNLDEILSAGLSAALPAIGKTIMSVFGAFPSFFLFVGVTLLAMFYFSCDYEKITAFVKRQLTEKQIIFVKELKNQFFTTVFGILRAYAILILLTFVQLWIGFLIADIKYATLLAALIAIIDILPVIGTGTVLVPWAVFLFLTGNLKTGLCISLLYVIITVIRQIAEPKILADSVGLHPLVTLMSMYFGLKLAGIRGLFLFPLAVIIIKNLNEKGYIRLYKTPDINKTYKTDYETKEK